MSYTTRNPTDLKDAILRRLGAPIINVEVTEDQIYDCISRALELFGEYHFDGVEKSYATFVLSKDQAKSGLFDLRGHNIYAVTQILRTNVGSIITMDGTAVYPWFTDFLMGMAGTGAGIGGCRFYGPNAYGADLGYFTQLMSYRGMMEDLLSPLPDYYYNDATEQLKITGNFQEGDLIIIEVYTKAYAEVDNMINDTAGYGFVGCDDGTFTSMQKYQNPNLSSGMTVGATNGIRDNGCYNNRWVKDYATALVKELNGTILAKHQGMQLPGGVTIDGVRMIEEAKIEIEKLREELYLLDPPMPIIMG